MSQGHRRPDGRAGRPDLARRDARRSSAGTAASSPPPPFVAVKAPAFSTAKLRGVDPSVGPGMQSTGEVIGIHTDPRVALAKALLGAALVPPRPGGDGRARAAVDRRPRQGTLCRGSRAALATAGYRLAATPGTRAALAAAGLRGAAGRQARRGGRRGDRRGRDPRPHRVRRGPAGGQHADAALGRGPRRRRDPAGGDRRGDPVPDRDGDRRRGRRGARPGDRRAPGRGPLARRVGARRRGPVARRSSAATPARRRPGRDPVSTPPAPSAAPTTIAWPSDHSVSVVSATMTTASGTWRRRSAAPSMPGRRVRGRARRARPRRPACGRRRRPPAGPSRRGPAAATPRSPRGRPSRTGPSPCWNGSEIATRMCWPSISR